MQPKWAGILLGLRISIKLWKQRLDDYHYQCKERSHPATCWRLEKKKLGDATTKTIFTVLVELPTHLQSSCSAILLIRYRCHAIRTYRYGTDRIGSIVVKMATMEQHVLMCMCGMLKKRRTDKVLKWCKFNFKNGTDNINVNTALIYLRWHYIL